MPKHNPPFSTFYVDLRVNEGVECETDAQVEAMAERIDDADIESALHMAVYAALERAGLDRELTVTIRT